MILANEVLDALPVTRFRWHADRVEELGVVIDGGRRFAWAARGLPSPLLTEACRRLADVRRRLGRRLRVGVLPAPDGVGATASPAACAAGAALWFDYGLPRSQYYLPERREGTLLCHFRHRAHSDPFLFPGLQDITAWVDYTALAEASRAAGFARRRLHDAELASWRAWGMDQEMQRMAGGDANRFARLANQARRLMLPGEMGERFKAMAWLRGLELPLAGFALQDLRHTL